MTAEMLIAMGVTLLLGLAAGYVLARMRRAPPEPVPYDPLEDETRPTLVPFRGDRVSGKNLAKLKPDAD